MQSSLSPAFTPCCIIFVFVQDVHRHLPCSDHMEEVVACLDFFFLYLKDLFIYQEQNCTRHWKVWCWATISEPTRFLNHERYCFMQSRLTHTHTHRPRDWWCVINLRTEQQHTSNLLPLSVTRYWFGSLPNRMMICVCLVWLTDNSVFVFFSPSHPSFPPSPLSSTPDIPVCHLSSISGVKRDLRERQGHQRHGMKIRVIVLNRQCLSLNPSARWPLSGREMASPPGSHIPLY